MQPGDLAGDHLLVVAESLAPFGRGEEVEEGDPGETVVAAPWRKGSLEEPAAELPAAGRGHAVEVAVRAAARSEDPEDDVALAPQSGESGVDLRDLRPPDGSDFVFDHASEVVSGARLRAQEAEKDVRKRHEKSISE